MECLHSNSPLSLLSFPMATVGYYCFFIIHWYAGFSWHELKHGFLAVVLHCLHHRFQDPAKEFTVLSKNMVIHSLSIQKKFMIYLCSFTYILNMTEKIILSIVIMIFNSPVYNTAENCSVNLLKSLLSFLKKTLK